MPALWVHFWKERFSNFLKVCIRYWLSFSTTTNPPSKSTRQCKHTGPGCAKQLAIFSSLFPVNSFYPHHSFNLHLISTIMCLRDIIQIDLVNKYINWLWYVLQVNLKELSIWNMKILGKAISLRSRMDLDSIPTTDIKRKSSRFIFSAEKCSGADVRRVWIIWWFHCFPAIILIAIRYTH